MLRRTKRFHFIGKIGWKNNWTKLRSKVFRYQSVSIVKVNKDLSCQNDLLLVIVDFSFQSELQRYPDSRVFKGFGTFWEIARTV